MEQYPTSFEVIFGSAEKAASLMRKLKDMAAKTPFSVADLTSGAQFLINYGMTAEDATERLKMLGDISQDNRVLSICFAGETPHRICPARTRIYKVTATITSL